MVNMGEKIRTLRLAKRLTQTEVALRIGVSKAMISSYELESRAPSYEILIKIATFFGVTTDFLLGLEKSRTIDCKGLNDEEINAVVDIIDVIRRK